jgi:hypothetical protein
MKLYSKYLKIKIKKKLNFIYKRKKSQQSKTIIVYANKQLEE